MKKETLIKNNWTYMNSDYSIFFDIVRAKEFVFSLGTAFRDKSHEFRLNNTIVETILPEGVSKNTLEHAVFILFATGLDSMRQSEHVYRCARQMVTQYDVKDFHKFSKDDWLDVIKAIKYGDGMNDPANIMLQLSTIIKEKSGDPREIFNGIHDYDVAASILTDIKGVSHGKAALIIKNYQRFGYLDLEDEYDSEIKIDRHVMRMAIGNEIAQVHGKDKNMIRIDKFEDPLRYLFREVFNIYKEKMISEGITPTDICDAKYIIGRKLCSEKNKTVCEAYCPIDCRQLVYMNKKSTYFEIPSETRSDGVNINNGKFRTIQMEMF